MKIEVWSDYVCPFCYIGKRRLEKALKGFVHNTVVSVEYKSYQLDPAAKYIPDKNFYEAFSELKGIPLSQAKEMNQQVREQAKAVGLSYEFDMMKYANTFDAHRLAQFANKESLGNEMTERLLQAYFTESALLSDRETLLELAQGVGLNTEEAEEVLVTERFARQVNDDIEIARQIGVQTVPFFVFNEKYAVFGAQSVEVFKEVLDKVWELESNNPVSQTSKSGKPKTTYCTDDGCEA